MSDDREEQRELLLQRTRRLVELIEMAAPEEMILKEYDLVGQTLGPRSHTRREVALQKLLGEMAEQLQDTTTLLNEERRLSDSLISELRNLIDIHKGMLSKLGEAKNGS